MSDGELQIDEFNMHRKDRKNTVRGGGVIMYVHESLVSVLITDVTVENFEESVWCVIHASKKVKLLASTLYRSANSSEQNARLFVLLTDIRHQTHITRHMAIRDFNLPEIVYEQCEVQTPENSFAMRFFYTTQDLLFI